MHSVDENWARIFAETGHQKEVKVTINGVEYNPEDDRLIRASISGSLFDAPSVGGAVSRTLELEIVPWDAPRGSIPPMSEIRLFVRLASADGTKSDYIPKGVFYSDVAKRDRDTGAVTINAFDAMLKMERPLGSAAGQSGGSTPYDGVLCRVTFFDGFDWYQHFKVEIGGAMPTPRTPSRTGEQFAEWYPDPSNTSAVVSDMLFTARWKKKFTVTFDSGDGTPQTFTCFDGDATPTPTTPAKSGYIFAGWTPTPAATVTADATYTALWTELSGIIVRTPPTKTTYKPGDTLDYTGLVVAFGADGAEVDVTADCEFDPAEGETVAWEEADA